MFKYRLNSCELTLIPFENEKLLSSMPKLECELCSTDIRGYYDISSQVVDLNMKLTSLAFDSALGNKSFGQGRVIILRDDVSCTIKYLKPC